MKFAIEYRDDQRRDRVDWKGYVEGNVSLSFLLMMRKTDNLSVDPQLSTCITGHLHCSPADRGSCHFVL